jgi:hypothetical protein
MDALATIATSVVPVFAIMALGFAYGHFRALPVRELTDLVMWVLIPCLVLSSIGGRPLELAEFGRIGGAALGVMLGCGLLAWLAFAGRPDRRAGMLGSMFMNSANMAFPLALLAFGEEGLARQVIFYAAVNLLHTSLGIALARGRGGLGEALRLPMVYTTLLAVGLASSGWTLPEALVRPLDMVGKATLPLMLLLLGVRLRRTRLGHLGPALGVSLIRLLAGAGLGFFFCWWLQIEGLARAAVLLGSAMPAAVFNAALAERYDLHPEMVASSVVLSTGLSLATIPVVLWLV